MRGQKCAVCNFAASVTAELFAVGRKAPGACFFCFPGCKVTASHLPVAFYGVGAKRGHGGEHVVNSSKENTSCPAGNSADFNLSFRSCGECGGRLQSASDAALKRRESFCVVIRPQRAKLCASTIPGSYLHLTEGIP